MQLFYRVWHLVIFRVDHGPVKKPPCIYRTYMYVTFLLSAELHPIVGNHHVPQGREVGVKFPHTEDITAARADLHDEFNQAFIFNIALT